MYKYILLVIFILIILIFLYLVYRLHSIYEYKISSNFTKDLKLLTSDSVYNKLKYVKPQQISVSGKLDIDTLKKSIESLQKQYNNLLNTNNSILSNIDQKKKENEILNTEIEHLNNNLIDKNKILNSLIPHKYKI
jgi:translation initiation factor 2B subunit (eIF-2B alpha/beta/delta family)